MKKKKFDELLIGDFIEGVGFLYSHWRIDPAFKTPTICFVSVKALYNGVVCRSVIDNETFNVIPTEDERYEKTRLECIRNLSESISDYESYLAYLHALGKKDKQENALSRYPEDIHMRAKRFATILYWRNDPQLRQAARLLEVLSEKLKEATK